MNNHVHMLIWENDESISQAIKRISSRSLEQLSGVCREYSAISDINFALDIFSKDRKKAINLFKSYTVEENTDKCLDYEESINLSDKEVINYLAKIGIVSISELQRFEKCQRDDVIRKVKKIQGVTIRQLARITEILKSSLGQ